MAICQHCGSNIPVSVEACPNCGTPVKQKKKKRVPAVFRVLSVLLLVVLAGAGGLFGYGLYQYYGGQAQPSVFSCTCAEYTTEINRLLDADGSTTLRLDTAKWAPNEAKNGMEYNGGTFVVRAKTEGSAALSSKIRELRVGPTDTGDGVKAAAASVIALEKKTDEPTVTRDMGEVKGQRKDKVSYETVAFTYDRDRDEFVLVPSKGAKSPEHYGATADQAAPLAVDEDVFVAGDKFIEAGGKYIFTDGESIRYRDKIAGSSTKITDTKCDGQLLSDGKTLYYIIDTGTERKVCSIGIGGGQDKLLFSTPDRITLIHFYHNTLYFVKEGGENPEETLFCKYSLDTKEFRQFDDIYLASDRTVVAGNLMYCSKGAYAVTDIQTTSAYVFNFDTEAYTEALQNCLVAPHGYVNGTGDPCLDSYNVDSTGTRYSDHYLYTSVKGELKQSAKITVDAALLLASPTSNQAILYDNLNTRYYLFDRSSGVTQMLTMPAAGSFVCDIDHPEEIYFYTIDTGSSNRRLSGIYKLVGTELKECTFGSGDILLGTNPVIADGNILDAKFDAHPITAPAGDAPGVTEATAAPAAETPTAAGETSAIAEEADADTENE